MIKLHTNMTLNVILRYLISEYHDTLFTYLMRMIILTFYLNADIGAVCFVFCAVIKISPELNTKFESPHPKL